MTNSVDTDNYGDQTNEQVVQMNEKIMCRSGFDPHNTSLFLRILLLLIASYSCNQIGEQRN